MKTLVFKWTVSRGRETYGYNICSLWVNNHKKTSCNGGGYDMEGVCLAKHIRENYEDRLMKLKSTGFYGLSFRNKKGKQLRTGSKSCVSVCLDGACGFECIRKIARATGLKLEYVHRSANETIYTLTDEKELC